MKYVKQYIGMVLVIIVTFSFIGCHAYDVVDEPIIQTTTTPVPISKTLDSDKTLYIYNSKGENAKQLTELMEAYSIIAGVKVKEISVGSGQDHMETLRREMASEHPPTIFSIQGIKELEEWVQKGDVLDLNTITQTRFKEMVTELDDGLRLTVDGVKSYGIPYNVEGYGYIVDKQMLADLFGLDNVDSLIKDIQKSTYGEWEFFIDTVDDYITNPTAATVRFNNKDYHFNATKKGLTNNLTGVFAVMGAEKWTYGDHFANVALNAAFNNPSEAYAADSSKLDSLVQIFEVYAKALDFKTQHMAGATGKATRGRAFISPEEYGYTPVLQLFQQGKSLFLKQGNWAYASIAQDNPEMAKRLEFLPVKMPITDEMITTKGLTAEKFNQSIPVFVPNYYAINSKVSEEEQKLAVQFLLWLNTSPAGQKYLRDDFDFIPYNADPAVTTLNNALGNSILRYIKEDNTLSAPYYGAPADWSSNVFGLKMMEDYMTKQEWTLQDYQDIARYAIDSWKRLK